MKRTFAILMVALVMVAVMALTVSVAFAREHHPPKFTGGNPNTTQPCGSTANHPNCPGNH